MKKADTEYKKNVLENTFKPSDKVHSGAAVSGLDRTYKDRSCVSQSIQLQFLTSVQQ